MQTEHIYINYMAINQINGKAYIGKTGNFRKRKQTHISRAMSGNNDCRIFYPALRKHGPENFKWYKLYETHDEKLAYKMETFFIKHYNTNTRKNNDSCGYNGNDGGKGIGLGTKTSQETRHRISISNTGKKRTQEQLEKRSKLSIKLWQNKEFRDKMSKALKLAFQKPEYREMSRNRYKDIEFAKKHKESVKKAMSRPEVIANIGKLWEVTFPDGHIENTHNMSEFCRKHNLSSGKMTLVAQGKRNHHKGFKCKHVK